MQAMLNIDDMFMLSQNKVASIFLEDVTEFLDSRDIFYSKDVSFVGNQVSYILMNIFYKEQKRNLKDYVKL